MANSSGTTHIVGPLAEAQARSGCTVSVFCVEKGSEPPVLSAPGLVDSRCFPRTLPLDNPGFSIQFAKVLGREVRYFDIVHIHAIWNFPSWWGMRTAYRVGVPYIVAPQGSLDTWALQQNWLGKKLYGGLTEVPLMRRAACLQAVTDKEAKQFRAFGLATDCEVVPNGIDEGLTERRNSPDPGYFGLSGDCQTLLFLSRVHPKKGLDLLLQAAENVRRSHSRLRFVIGGGDGGSGYLAAIRGECSKRNLDDVVIFMGELNGQRKLDTFAAADAFLLPSYSEGLPVAALEALASGLPALVTVECNLPEIEAHQAGYIVKPDSQSIAVAIDRLFSLPDDERQVMGDNARRLAVRRFTWGRICEQTLAIYRRILGGEMYH